MQSHTHASVVTFPEILGRIPQEVLRPDDMRFADSDHGNSDLVLGSDAGLDDEEVHVELGEAFTWALTLADDSLDELSTVFD